LVSKVGLSCPEWRGEGSFGLVCCLDRADRTREEGLTEGGDMGIGGGAGHQLGELL